MSGKSRTFKSSDELFQVTRDLITDLERDGLEAVAEDLRRGLGALNGLTDGWAQFLESIEGIEHRYARQLGDSRKAVLEDIRRAAHAAVHRRNR